MSCTWGVGVSGTRCWRKKTHFPHVHYDHLFLTRFFLVFQAIALACLRPLTKGSWLTVHSQDARQSLTEASQSVSTWDVLLLLGIWGDREWPIGHYCFPGRNYRHWFLGKWREAHFAQMSSIKSQFATWYWVHWTLMAGSWANVVPHGMPPPSWPSSTPPSQRDDHGRRKQKTDTLETTECVNHRLAQGHKLLWTFCQSLLNSPARFCMMLNYYAD
jgi:hypothetical protein